MDPPLSAPARRPVKPGKTPFAPALPAPACTAPPRPSQKPEKRKICKTLEGPRPRSLRRPPRYPSTRRPRRNSGTFGIPALPPSERLRNFRASPLFAPTACAFKAEKRHGLQFRLLARPAPADLPESGSRMPAHDRSACFGSRKRAKPSRCPLRCIPRSERAYSGLNASRGHRPHPAQLRLADLPHGSAPLRFPAALLSKVAACAVLRQFFRSPARAAPSGTDSERSPCGQAFGRLSRSPSPRRPGKIPRRALRASACGTRSTRARRRIPRLRHPRSRA